MAHLPTAHRLMPRVASHETPEWWAAFDRMGHVLIVRKADAASVYLQGDDARAFDAQMSNIRHQVENYGEDFNRLLGLVCEAYSEVLEA